MKMLRMRKMSSCMLLISGAPSAGDAEGETHRDTVLVTRELTIYRSRQIFNNHTSISGDLSNNDKASIDLLPIWALSKLFDVH